jgi:hypothetical protein
VNNKHGTTCDIIFLLVLTLRFIATIAEINPGWRSRGRIFFSAYVVQDAVGFPFRSTVLASLCLIMEKTHRIAFAALWRASQDARIERRRVDVLTGHGPLWRYRISRFFRSLVSNCLLILVQRYEPRRIASNHRLMRRQKMHPRWRQGPGIEVWQK